jgi:hypothetical protein
MALQLLKQKTSSLTELVIVDLKKKTICEAGWKKGYDVGIKRND